VTVLTDPPNTAGAAEPLLVRCENLVHVYGTAGSEVAALRGVDLGVRAGEMVALLGPSGSGKSTLLWHLAGLLRPTAGTVDVNGHRLAGMTPSELATFRLREVGIVLQNASRNLLPYLSAADNVVYAQQPIRLRRKLKAARAARLLESVGLSRVASHAAGRLSGGEQQRLSLAVALANGPKLLLADEPTSQLDVDSARAVIALLKAANSEFGTTIVMVTHDPAIGTALGRSITIHDGRIGAEGRAGEDYLVVGRDGSVQIPLEMADVLPPGSLARAVRLADGVQLRRVDPDAPVVSNASVDALDEPETDDDPLVSPWAPPRGRHSAPESPSVSDNPATPEPPSTGGATS
jgi:putative ABC transport system ATP-binding protein